MTDRPKTAPPTDASLPDRIPVGLAAGPDFGETVVAAIAAAGGIVCGSCLVDEMVIVGGAGLRDERSPTWAAAEVVRTLAERQIARVRLAVPPAGLGLGRWAASRGGWISVNVSARGTRLPEILIQRELAAIGSHVAVTSIVGDRRQRPPLAIGLWTAYAHPRHAIGARLTGDRYGLAAEIALAFAPRLSVITAEISSQTVVAASADMIAAELVGLALHREQSRRGEPTELEQEHEQPWMDPLVQRATELRLGVTTPDRIALVSAWTGPPGGEAGFAALVDRVRLALGIPDRPNSGAGVPSSR